VSRRKRPPARTPEPGGGEQTPSARGGADAGRRIAVDVAILVAVFAVTAAIAELAGAANLGVALGVGQVAFAIALVVLLIRG
jgi:hypothetical protein